jgi:predicted membrane GTPase involved in stress response
MLEQAIAYIDDDEMVEVTPKSIVDANECKRASRAKQSS